jgi:hypothetical protein
MAYWGLAQFDAPRWSTRKWLADRAQQTGKSSGPEKFAKDLAGDLTAELLKLKLTGSTGGIGIHFTAYERINGYWIPELFLISNWADTSYRATLPGGMVVSRETFHGISGQAPHASHGDPAFRLQVRTFLEAGNLLTFNNGDPLLYSSAANGIFAMFQQIASRGILADPDSLKMWAALARRPVEIVSAAQRDFCRRGQRIVGGKSHDMAIAPNGQSLSTTGD